jgi:hypothetical protein
MEWNSKLFSIPWNDSEQNSKCLLLFLFEWNSEFFSLPRNGSEKNSKCLLLFLFYRTEFSVVFSSVEWFRTEFREFYSILFYFCSTVHNSEHFYPLRNGSVWNGIMIVICTVECRDSTVTNQLFHLFHLPRNNFLLEIANPKYSSDQVLSGRSNLARQCLNFIY